MKKILTFMFALIASTAMSFAQDATTWTVAGSAAALNGTTDWDPANADNDMTTADGVNYTLTVKGCTLEKGTTYQYKVVKNHAWGEEYPSSNKTFSVSETAVYTVAYSFNANSKEVSEVCTKTGAAGEISHIYTVAGQPASLFNDVEWDEAAAVNDMTKGDDGLYTYKTTGIGLSTTDDHVAFKVTVDHGWGEAYPASNYEIPILENGYFDLTVTFNPETKEVKGELTKTIQSVELWLMDAYGNQKSLPMTNTPSGYVVTIDRSNVWVWCKLVVNGGGSEADGWAGWLGSQQLTVNAPEGWVWMSDNTGENLDLSMFNGTVADQFATFDVTAIWQANPDYSKGWILTFAGRDEKIANVGAVALQYGNASHEWQPLYLQNSEDAPYTYTGILDLSDTEEDMEFKLHLKGGDNNDEAWLGAYQVSGAGNTQWLQFGEEGSNIILKNSESNYQTYNVTATWTPSNRFSEQWSIAIEGRDIRGEKTYTATFVNVQEWDEVAAYAFSYDADGGVKVFTAAFPGNVLERTGNTVYTDSRTGDEVLRDVYTLNITATAMPQYVIFSNNKMQNEGGIQTSDLPFVNGKQYIIENYIDVGINNVQNVATGAQRVFDLQGRKLQGTPLNKGLYIVNGKKIVK